MAGTELYGRILEDVAEVHRRIPRERMRCALEIPYIVREIHGQALGMVLQRP
jgi:hypothetical protein